MYRSAAFIALSALLLPIVAACSAGPAAQTLPPAAASIDATNVAPAAEPLSTEPVTAEALSTERATLTQAGTSASGRLYVANAGSAAVTVYAATANGNVAPLARIAGVRTGITAPGPLAQDATGALYVANNGSTGVPNVLVFAHGANGDAAPLRRLFLPASFRHIEALTVDLVTGKLFVVADRGNVQVEGNVALLRYPPGANGNAAPFAIGTIAFPAVQLTSNSGGNAVIEAHGTNAPSGVGFGVETLAKQFPNGVAVPTLSDTEWFEAFGIVDDPSTKTYLATNPGGIYRFAETANGSVGGPGHPTITPPPISIVTSDHCGTQLALGGLRNIFVAHARASGCLLDAVFVYPHDAAGNASTLRVLNGPATQLDDPSGIAVGA